MRRTEVSARAIERASSDPTAVKPANKAKKSTAEASAGEVAAELVGRRAGTKGNAGQQSTCRAQSRISVSQACGNYLPFGPEVGEAMGRGGGGCGTLIVHTN